jgi:transposase
LRQLSKHLRGPVVVLWDSGNQHKGTPVREFIQSHRNWTFHRFPAYAPELNPDEFVWAQLKRAVANSTPADNDELKQLLHRPLMRLRQSQKLLWSCIHASELPW